jgi:hypothetical protein
MSHYRNPMFVLTDDKFNAKGAIVVDNGRWVAHDTTGAVLANRKDMDSALRACTSKGYRTVSSAWHGVTTEGTK